MDNNSKRLLILAALGVAVGVLARNGVAPSSDQDKMAEAAVANSHGSEKSADVVRQEARTLARRHLGAASEQSAACVGAHLPRLDRFFMEAKRRTPDFAADALSIGSKWRLLVDGLPFTNGDRHQRFLRSKFEEHLFAPETLEKLVRQTVERFLQDLEAIDNDMLVKLQLDLQELPSVLKIQTLDKASLQAAFRKSLEEVGERVAGKLRDDVAVELVSLVVGEVLAQAAVRLGVSAGILGSGAAYGWVTFGAGIVLGLVVDQLISWAWDWWADPRGEVAALLNDRLDEIHRLIVEGEGPNKGLRQRLEELTQARSQVRSQAIMALIEERP